ncbi:conjugal transfer protein [Peribacillus frigoritolerans]|uniref:conjugal transfer protein n=1 Tax=Peribacillus frigoritolerans TaxID=450367 RepID=UPI00105A5000|nr:conjugal transfer protein [Peribacillus frigoritolerans]TDL76174.1 conjugal transfer protein [Peribacillus frigoritolerans]
MRKREYPKTVLRKKMIKGTFWTAFALVLFLSVVAIVRVGNAGADAAEEKQIEEVKEEDNPALGVGAQSFAENFASEYFKWENTDEEIKKRADRLQPFLANGLDQQAGLAFEGMEHGSEITESQVWNVEEKAENTALITLQVQHTLKKSTPPDAKAVEQAKKDKKPLPKVKEEKSEPYEKYIVVPVKSDGSSYVVHKVPYFVPPAKKPEITSDTSVSEEGKIQDSKLQEEINSGLTTFFKVYTTGTQEELSYYTKSDEIKAMTGITTFKEVKETIIKQGDGKNEYKIHATVTFEENQSKAQVTYPYELTLVKEENRLFVKEMKNQ